MRWSRQTSSKNQEIRIGIYLVEKGRYHSILSTLTAIIDNFEDQKINKEWDRGIVSKLFNVSH